MSQSKQQNEQQQQQGQQQQQPQTPPPKPCYGIVKQVNPPRSDLFTRIACLSPAPAYPTASCSAATLRANIWPSCGSSLPAPDCHRLLPRPYLPSYFTPFRNALFPIASSADPGIFKITSSVYGPHRSRYPFDPCFQTFSPFCPSFRVRNSMLSFRTTTL